MSEQEQEQEQERSTRSSRGKQSKSSRGKGYHVSDLTEGQEPDPLGDASLSARERAGATGGE
jgi:hypothetical protein